MIDRVEIINTTITEPLAFFVSGENIPSGFWSRLIFAMRVILGLSIEVRAGIVIQGCWVNAKIDVLPDVVGEMLPVHHGIIGDHVRN